MLWKYFRWPVLHLHASCHMSTRVCEGWFCEGCFIGGGDEVGYGGQRSEVEDLRNHILEGVFHIWFLTNCIEGKGKPLSSKSCHCGIEQIWISAISREYKQNSSKYRTKTTSPHIFLSCLIVFTHTPLSSPSNTSSSTTSLGNSLFTLSNSVGHFAITKCNREHLRQGLFWAFLFGWAFNSSLAVLLNC